MDISKLTQEQRDNLSRSAQIWIDAVLSETTWKTYTLIQEEVIKNKLELVENPFISDAVLLVWLLMTQVRFWVVNTIRTDWDINLEKSKFDIESFFDFVSLWGASQSIFILELCWLQAMRKETSSYEELRNVMLEIFSKTWKEKQTLFRLIDPELLRVYYKKASDSWRHKKTPTTPNLLVTS